MGDPQNDTAAAAAEEEVVTPSAPAPAKPKLPKGLTQDMVDAWKAEYGDVINLTRVAGVAVVVRPVTRQEWLAARQASRNEEGLLDTIMAKGVLWNDNKPGINGAGYRQGCLRAVGEVSQVGADVMLAYIDDDLLKNWPDVAKNYKEGQAPKVESITGLDKEAWVLLTDDQVYVLTYVNKSDYDSVAEKNPEALDDRMLQHGVLWPRMSTAQLKALPYGLYQILQQNVSITSGFEHESPVKL